MLNISNANEIQAVRILYVVQTSAVDQSNEQHVIHKAIVAISKKAVTTICFLSLALSDLFFFCAILKKERQQLTGNKQLLQMTK